ncbi:MAG: type II secretion system F family protein [Ilumatobacteraceae bacterium]
MTGAGAIIVWTVVTTVGVLVVAVAAQQPAPGLRDTLVRLGRSEVRRRRWSGVWSPTWFVALADSGRRWMPSRIELGLVGRSPERYAASAISAAFVGAVAPTVVMTMLQRAGLLGFGVVVPVATMLGGAVLGPAVLHAVTVERAALVMVDLRHQTSAYLDVVTMLLAANTGYEGALEQASRAGDGRLFVELRHRMLEAGARGTSLTEALRRTGLDLGLEELDQVGGTASLAASQGAPVARTLAAKCATLRAALATQQESEARLRTSRLTSPIVGMALIFMALVIYPALAVT